MPLHRLAIASLSVGVALFLFAARARADTTLPNGCVVATNGTCMPPCAIDTDAQCKPDNCGALAARLAACHPGAGGDDRPYFTGCTPDFSPDGVCHVLVHGVCDEKPMSNACGSVAGCNINLSDGCSNFVPAAGYPIDLDDACASAEYLELEPPLWGASACTATALVGTPNVAVEFHSWGTTFGAAFSIPGRYNGGLCPQGPQYECVIDEGDVVPTAIFACWYDNPAHVAMVAAGSASAMTPPPTVDLTVGNLTDRHSFARYVDCHDAPDSACPQPTYACGEAFTPAGAAWNMETFANCPYFSNTAACPKLQCPAPACLTGDHSPGCLCFANADCDSNVCINDCGIGGTVIGVCL